MSGAVLVVGGTGKVGSEVTRQLVDKGERVRVCTRNPAGATVPEGAMAVAFDLAKPDTWDATFAGADRLFLLAPEGEPDPATALAPLVERAAGAGTRKVALMTAMGAETFEGPYLRAEQMVAASGLPHTFLRPNWFMQNFNAGMYCESIRNAGGIFIPAADAKVSFVDTRDIAAVAVAALTNDEHTGKGYTITGGRALDHAEAMAILSAASDKTISYTPISDDDMRKALAEEGTPTPMIELFSELFAVMRDGATEPVSPHVSQVLGREPITFEAYAQAYASAWR